MRKRIFIINIILSVLFAFNLAACGAETNSGELLMNFDDYKVATDLYVENCQVKCEIASGKDEFTEGAGALKVTIIKPTVYAYHTYGEPNNSVPPVLRFGLKDKKNLSEIVSVTLDVYNANDYNTNFYLYSETSGDKLAFISYALAEKGKWNTLCFSINNNIYNSTVSDFKLAVADFNENSVYYLDNLRVNKGEKENCAPSTDGNNILSFDRISDVKSVEFWTKTDIPAFRYSLATDENNDRVLAIYNENYTGRKDPLSYVFDDRTYGFTVGEKILKNVKFDAAKKIYIEAYNGCKTAKKVTLTVNDGVNDFSREETLPVGEWKKIAVNNLINADKSNVKQVQVSVKVYDNFDYGVIYFRNLTVGE